MINLSDNIVEFKRIKESLDNHNLIIIVGDSGTGKTEFVNNYLKNYKNYLVVRIDSNTPKPTILNHLKSKNFLYSKKVLLYDDISIKTDLLKQISKFIHPTHSDKKFICIINKLKPSFENLTKYVIHKTRYPTKNEVYRFLQEVTYHRVREDPPKKPISDELKKSILSMKTYNMRRIQFAIEDGFITEEIKIDDDRFNITKMNPFMVSQYIAENLGNLRRLKGNIEKADKLKYVNDHFYIDFIKIFYPHIERKRLRYPKQTMEIIKNKKN